MVLILRDPYSGDKLKVHIVGKGRITNTEHSLLSWIDSTYPLQTQPPRGVSHPTIPIVRPLHVFRAAEFLSFG